MSICSNIIVQCPPKLIDLLSHSFPKITFRPEPKNSNHEIEDFDYQVPMETLFGYACLSGKIADNQASYIIPNQERVEYWEKKLRENTQKICVGISWKSPVMTAERKPNYTEVSDWAPILSLKNITYINLQAKDFEDDLHEMKELFGVDVYNFEELDHYDDLDDVSALCSAIDMCISVSTGVSAIASAVGTDTKMLHWKQSSWNNIIQLPQGPSVEVFERNTWETWRKPMNDIKKEICRLLD